MSDQYFSMGEISRQSGLPAHTIRYYERLFPGYFEVLRTPGGHRKYPAETIDRLKTITRLSSEKGLTLRGVKQALELEGHPSPEKAMEIPSTNSETEARPSEELLRTLLRICREKQTQTGILLRLFKKAMAAG